MRSVLSILGTFAILATACTAVVAGKVGGKDDYKKTDSTSTTSGNLDKCSLLTDRYNAEKESNECSECIATECKEDVEYACNREGSKKPWFENLADCAQNPYVSYGPQGSSFYDCNHYKDAGPPFTGSQEDDAAKRRNSEICVNKKCMTGETPPCRLCPVWVKKPGTDDRAALGSLPCGQCIEQNCKKEIVECCETAVISYHVTACAYVDAPELKEKCNEILTLDGGKINNGNDSKGEFGEACQLKIKACFEENCASACQ